LVEAAFVPDGRRDAAVPREDPPRVLLAPEDLPDPDDLLAGADLLDPDDGPGPEARVERVAFLTAEPALRLARGLLEAAAARSCPAPERLLRGDALDADALDADALDVLPAPPREVVAALRVLAVPREVVAALGVLALAPLAWLPAVFRLVCFRELFVVATGPPFQGLDTRYPLIWDR
jgi:hypothetical protein